MLDWHNPSREAGARCEGAGSSLLKCSSRSTPSCPLTSPCPTAQLSLPCPAIRVQVMEPVSSGASIYEEPDQITPVLITDIRMGPRPDSHSGHVGGKVELKEVPMLGRTRGSAEQKPRFELPSDTKQAILSSLVRDVEYVEERAAELKQSHGSSAWECGVCTYFNVTAKKRCGMCKSARPAPQAQSTCNVPRHQKHSY